MTMVQVISKLSPINVSCIEYVHPWTQSCLEASAGLYLHCIYDCFRIYGTVYTLALLMKGRIPRFEDIRRTFAGLMQSVAFLSATGLGYSAFLCSLRRLCGNFNILTVSAMPIFLSSILAIHLERPSRRPLLCLYVSNVATETVWNMLESRGMVRNIPYAPTMIFSTSIAMLLMYYKGGQHKTKDGKSDSIFGLLRFVVGPYEEHEYVQKRSEQMSHYTKQQQQASTSDQGPSRGDSGPQSSYPSARQRCKPSNKVFHLVNQALRVYRILIHKIKCCGRHLVCPHPFSCLYYTLQGTTKMFTTGLGIQIALKLVFNLHRIIAKPRSVKQIFFKRDVFALASFLAGFTGIFRAISCFMRWMTGRDNQYYALLAGLLAGTAFTQYSDTTIALYVMWKLFQIIRSISLVRNQVISYQRDFGLAIRTPDNLLVFQLTYNMGIESGHVPRVPGFTKILYCFSTAILFHAGIVEPNNLRPSYYKFLHNLSGGRISSMDRTALDVWGCESTKQIAITLKKTKTDTIVRHII